MERVKGKICWLGGIALDGTWKELRSMADLQAKKLDGKQIQAVMLHMDGVERFGDAMYAVLDFRDRFPNVELGLGLGDIFCDIKVLLYLVG